MATVSSHLLNGMDGSHAAHVKIRLNKVKNEGSRTIIFDSQTDSGGRLVETLDENTLDVEASYELQIDTRRYWLAQQKGGSRANTCAEIVFRFSMPDAGACYHIPFIISPNNYSVWWSAPE